MKRLKPKQYTTKERAQRRADRAQRACDAGRNVSVNRERVLRHNQRIEAGYYEPRATEPLEPLIETPLGEQIEQGDEPYDIDPVVPPLGDELESSNGG